jgi:hypothetical protein
LRIEAGLIDKGRGASTTKKGTRIDRLLVVDLVSHIYSANPPEGYDNRDLSLPVRFWRRLGPQ